MGFVLLDSTVEEPVALAFSVTSNQHEILDGAVVRFQTKLVEDRGAFDMENSVYTVPSSGYYIFHFFR